MTNLPGLANLTSSNPPRPIPPVPPNFTFCHNGYGTGLSATQALFAASRLPTGATPVQYTIDPGSPPPGREGFFQLPLEVTHGGVSVSVEVSSPVNLDSIMLRPDDIRGMAGFLASSCVGTRHIGGWITRGIQDVIDFVTDPSVDLDTDLYPPDTAFITVTMSPPGLAYSAPGDYDPFMAVFLQQQISDALAHSNPMDMHPMEHMELADRLIRFGVQAQKMHRLGHVAWWDLPSALLLNASETSPALVEGQGNNSTATKIATSRRKKRHRSRPSLG